jgi:hypothetical protein
MQPYVPSASSLPAPVARSAGDANLQSLLGYLAQQPGSGGSEGLSSGSAHSAEGEPIRPEAMRILSQPLGGGASSHGGGAGAQQLLAGLAGGPLPMHYAPQRAASSPRVPPCCSANGITGGGAVHACAA